MPEKLLSLPPMKVGKDTKLADLIDLVSNIYTYDGYVPSSEVLSKVQVSDIINYLRVSHRYYVDVALTSLESTIHSVLEPCEERIRKVIFSFYTTYRDEMLTHFRYEEEKVFPYAEALLEGQHPEVVQVGEEDHTDIVEKIDDLKNIVTKYLPPECDPVESVALLKQLLYLSDDLRKHTAIEDHILVPMIRRMERG